MLSCRRWLAKAVSRKQTAASRLLAHFVARKSQSSEFEFTKFLILSSNFFLKREGIRNR
jgi:hypothetical protein